MTIKQTAGRDALGEFAPKFAQLNDDVLFGEVWSREDGLSLRDRSVVTVVALMAQGLTDSSFQFPSDVRKEQRRDQDGDSGNPYARGVLRGMAQGVGGLPHGEGGLGGRGRRRRRKGPSTKTRWPFPSVPPTTHSRSTLSGKATSRPFPPNRSAFTTLRSSPAAATTGTHITPKAVAGRSSSAWLVEGFTRNGANRHKSCALAM